jgi:hypothetical protein
MPEIITVEEAIFQLVEVLEHTPPEDRPPLQDLLLAVAWGYGEEVPLALPWSG